VASARLTAVAILSYDGWHMNTTEAQCAFSRQSRTC
jgi:hypothetical protein